MRVRRLLSGVCLSLTAVLLLCSPLWAVEILMSRSGFDNWMWQRFAPREQRLDSMERQAGEMAKALARWEEQNMYKIYLWLDNTTVEYYGPGGVSAGTATLDVPPRIVDGRTMAPLRFVGEVLGAEVIWDGETQQVAYTAGERRITLTVGQATATIGGYDVVMDIPPMIINDRTMVPVRFVSQWLGAIVRWDEALRRVEISYMK